MRIGTVCGTCQNNEKTRRFPLPMFLYPLESNRSYSKAALSPVAPNWRRNILQAWMLVATLSLMPRNRFSLTFLIAVFCCSMMFPFRVYLMRLATETQCREGAPLVLIPVYCFLHSVHLIFLCLESTIIEQSCWMERNVVKLAPAAPISLDWLKISSPARCFLYYFM